MDDIDDIRTTLHDGEHYAGVILGKDGASDYHVILLPQEVEEASWNNAMRWAESVGGQLPTRRELSLLLANLREHFKRVWYWSSEPQEPGSHLVWGQNFTSGIQTMYGRPYRGHARAIRRLTSFSSPPHAP